MSDELAVKAPAGHYVIKTEKGMGLDLFGRNPGRIVHGYNGLLIWQDDDGTECEAARCGLCSTAKAAKLKAGPLRFAHQNYLAFNGERLEIARQREQARYDTAR